MIPLRCMAAVAVVSVIAPEAAVAGQANHDTATALITCHRVVDEAERLKCYDAIALQVSPPTFSGRLTATTDRFTISVPHVLRYESDGPIFVMYLKNDAGDVLQNLHIGGGGQQTYLISEPGTYFLTVSGSETWRIWLEPEPTQNQ